MKTIDVNSVTNQEIKSNFVGREVLGNVNTLVEYALNKSYEDPESPLLWDDVKNLYKYPEYTGKYVSFYSGSEEEFEETKEELEEKIKELADEGRVDEAEEARQELDELNNLETEPQEIFEWWLVTSWLAEKLAEKGEPVVSDGNNDYWGRTTTGQAILLDSVISEICKDLEILDGQSSSWAK